MVSARVPSHFKRSLIQVTYQGYVAIDTYIPACRMTSNYFTSWNLLGSSISSSPPTISNLVLIPAVQGFKEEGRVKCALGSSRTRTWVYCARWQFRRKHGYIEYVASRETVVTAIITCCMGTEMWQNVKGWDVIDTWLCSNMRWCFQIYLKCILGYILKFIGTYYFQQYSHVETSADMSDSKRDVPRFNPGLDNLVCSIF